MLQKTHTYTLTQTHSHTIIQVKWPDSRIGRRFIQFNLHQLRLNNNSIRLLCQKADWLNLSVLGVGPRTTGLFGFLSETEYYYTQIVTFAIFYSGPAAAAQAPVSNFAVRPTSALFPIISLLITNQHHLKKKPHFFFHFFRIRDISVDAVRKKLGLICLNLTMLYYGAIYGSFH